MVKLEMAWVAGWDGMRVYLQASGLCAAGIVPPLVEVEPPFPSAFLLS